MAGLLAYQLDVLKELNDGWVDEVVAATIGNERLDDWFKKIISDNVSIVEFVLETNYPPAEPQSSWRKEREREREENVSQAHTRTAYSTNISNLSHDFTSGLT